MIIQVSEDHGVYLSALKLEHAQELFELIDCNREYLSKWLTWTAITKQVSDSHHFIKNCLERNQESNILTMGIFRNGKIIGCIGQNNVNKTNLHYELGYWLCRKHSGQGIMTLSCQAFAHYLFTKENFRIVYIAIASQNKSSRKVAERIGAKLDGIIRQREILLDSSHVDHAYYSVTKEELLAFK